MAETFHVDDDVSFTGTSDNYGHFLAGEPGWIEEVGHDRYGAFYQVGTHGAVVKCNPEDITLINCPHQDQENQP